MKDYVLPSQLMHICWMKAVFETRDLGPQWGCWLTALPGSGKTLIALLNCVSTESFKHVLVLAPASVYEHWCLQATRLVNTSLE